MKVIVGILAAAITTILLLSDEIARFIDEIM